MKVPQWGPYEKGRSFMCVHASGWFAPKPPQSFSIIVLNQPCNNNISPGVIPAAVLCAQAPKLLPNSLVWCLHCWQDTVSSLPSTSHSHTVWGKSETEHMENERQWCPHSCMVYQIHRAIPISSKGGVHFIVLNISLKFLSPRHPKGI